MADFNMRVWSNERVYMVDFGRAPARRHPTRVCPDIDRWGYEDEAYPRDHGPIVSARIGQPRVNVRFFRTEISTEARLYAVAADGNRTIRILRPRGGRLPQRRAATISFRAVRMGRTSIDIRYHWPDGPVIGRLYVESRRTSTVQVRVHNVTVNGNGHANRFLGENRPGGMTAAAHQARRIRSLINETNQILEPHAIFLNLREVVNSAWTNATFGAAASGTARLMRAMAFSPNRSRNRVNVYLVNASHLPFGFSGGLGPPVAWAISTGRRWPNNATGRVGSGIALDTNTHTVPDIYLAHEFGHVFSLCRIVTSGANAGRALQWHTTGDVAGAGPSHGHASRDDTISRRRLMYNTNLQNSNNTWRNNVGYGLNQEGVLLMQRRLARDITSEESSRAYVYSLIINNIYAR
jgi:hypothetical protein